MVARSRDTSSLPGTRAGWNSEKAVGCLGEHPVETQRLKLSHVHLSGMFCSRYDVGGATSANMKGTITCSTQ